MARKLKKIIVPDSQGNPVEYDVNAADADLYEQIGDNFSYIRDFTELGAFSITDIDAESDNPNRVRSKIFTINALTQIKTIDPTDMLAVYSEDTNGTVTRIANNVNTVTLTDTSLRYRYTGRTADDLSIPVSKIHNFATRNDRNLNLNNRFRDAIAITVDGGTLNIIQDGSSIHAEVSANIAVISNDGYTRLSAGSSETFTLSLNQNYIVYAENGEVKFLSNREDSPITPKEAGKNRIFIGLVRNGELYTWVSENVLFNGSAPRIIGGGTGHSNGANLMQIFPVYSVVGDSLACGFMNIDGVSVSSAKAKAYGNNWVKYLSLRTGRRFNNLAVGGSTTTLWRNTHINTANVATSAYIIGLGVNDRRSQVTVGSESDIKRDYTQNAVSTYGNLDYIVNKLKEFNPYCHIFMLTIPAIEDTYNLSTFRSCERQNAAIRYVAGLHNNVHLIDLHDVDDYGSELISNAFIANHFNPISYAFMSTLIESTINAYMAGNYSLFRTAPYHPDGTCEQSLDGGIDASTASEGQVLTADGNGGIRWDDNNMVPAEVRQALLTLLNNAIYRDVDLEDEKSIIQSWASTVTSISLNHKSISFSSVQVILLEAVTVPSNVLVTWTSSNPSVATVNDGAVAPVSNGQCIITATAGDMSATCSVSVNAFASVTSIDAVYSQKGYVFDTDALNSLKSNLSVIANYSDGTSQTVNNYALTGTLAAGTSQVTVAYADKTTTFDVVASTLPTGYTKYDYVRNKVYGSSNKTIIIDTKLGGEYCDVRYEHEIEMALTVRHVAEGSGSSFYCKRNAAGTVVASRSIWNASATSYNVQICDRSIGTDSDVNANIQVPAGQKVNIRTAVDKVYRDGELYCTVNNDTFTPINSSYTTYGIALFGQVTGNTWYGTGDEGKIYKFVVKDLDTDDYVAYLVACTNPSGNAGFYDMVRETFYTSSTPANLECGND